MTLTISVLIHHSPLMAGPPCVSKFTLVLSMFTMLLSNILSADWSSDINTSFPSPDIVTSPPLSIMATSVHHILHVPFTTMFSKSPRSGYDSAGSKLVMPYFPSSVTLISASFSVSVFE